MYCIVLYSILYSILYPGKSTYTTVVAELLWLLLLTDSPLLNRSLLSASTSPELTYSLNSKLVRDLSWVPVGVLAGLEYPDSLLYELEEKELPCEAWPDSPKSAA